LELILGHDYVGQFLLYLPPLPPLPPPPPPPATKTRENVQAATYTALMPAYFKA